jgi:hypothetical protein
LGKIVHFSLGRFLFFSRVWLNCPGMNKSTLKAKGSNEAGCQRRACSKHEEAEPDWAVYASLV